MPGVTLSGPARQGDIFHAVRDLGATSVGLIDGAFLDVPAVWHREILWALEYGVRVFGSASMGALRAAELHAFGMRGVGTIYEAYRSGVFPGWAGAFEDDDEVAIVHAPAELGYRPLSDAMVDLRFTLGLAQEDGVVSEAQREALAGQMKALHFPARRRERLKEIAAEAGCADLVGWLEAPRASLKALDAVSMLQAMGQGGEADVQPFRMRQVVTWVNFVASARRLTRKEREAVAALCRDPGLRTKLEREALGRMASLQGCPSIQPGSPTLSAFCQARGLETRAAMVEWASENHLDEAGVLRLAGEEATLRDAVRRSCGDAMDGTIADLLRLDGHLWSMALEGR